MGNQKPLVTVVLTAYNHGNYIEEALSSVFIQQYPHIELIVIDNASTDNTLSVIEEFKRRSPDFILIKNLFNAGLCKAFNQGLELATGKYIIDLSGDDIMLQDRIEKQVLSFESCSQQYAVVFSNACNIDSDGNFIGFHYPVDFAGKSKVYIPDGDVYKMVLEKYFICTPTMMIRTEVLQKLGGYDESLCFEDFDFWIRSAIQYKYFYLDEVLTLKRRAPGSLATKVYEKGSGMLNSYYAVCRKAYDLNRDQQEFDLLAFRIRSFIRKCFYAEEFELAVKFRDLLREIKNPGLVTEIIVLLCCLRIRTNRIYRFYVENIHKFRGLRKDLTFRSVN